MCGISGFTSPIRSLDSGPVIEQMLDSIISRGPDAAGVWSDHNNVCFGHRRLAILELSDAGAQPITSNCGRFVVSFNGEIYNHLKLRERIEAQFGLKKTYWRGMSDTETLVEAISFYGLNEVLPQLSGMFAFSVFDKEELTLSLVRDRFGEKPLFFSLFKDAFGVNHIAFSSTIGSLRCHPSISKSFNFYAIQNFLSYGYFLGADTVYSSINKLSAGSVLVFCLKSRNFTKNVYWSAMDVAVSSKSQIYRGTIREAKVELRDRLAKSVESMMLSDVPIGAFLSGGIDSSLIVSVMQSISSVPVKTFSIGFDEPGFDESSYARDIARFLGTEHTEFRVTSQDAFKILEELPSIFGEPFGDPSAIPTFLVSRLAKEHVTVCLTGDSGDELFGGYNRYVLSQKYWSKISLIPLFLRKFLFRVLSSLSYDFYAGIVKILNKFGFVNLSVSHLDKFIKAIRIIPSVNVEDLYDRLVRHDVGLSVIKDSIKVSTADIRSEESISESQRSFAAQESMMLLDTLYYMCDDILCKVDRTTMANSLESRVPFLDHSLFAFAWRLPLDFKIDNGKGKVILRDLLADFLPTSLFDRPKMGFGVPVGEWLKGPLKGWAKNVISQSNVERFGVLDFAEVNRIFEDHVSGRRNHQYLLWNILMLQLWFNEAHGEDD